MICAECGAQMNHHADKIYYVDAVVGDEPIDAELGGILKEIHTCPKCGNVQTETAKI